jgi:uroporphyrin-III C-methyltransferase
LCARASHFIFALGRALDSDKKVAGGLGKVFLVGAGPGDPELITLKGKRCLEAADVVLYDELANAELLCFARPDAELLHVGKKAGVHGADQRDIEARLIREARAGKNVVRLKGGDPFLFGRGGEEVAALCAAGIPCEVIPGISSALAVPASAGIPVTQRGVASSVAIVSGHQAAKSVDAIHWGDLARSVDTLIILMGLQNLSRIMNRLRTEGCPSDCPVALIQSGTLPEQKIVTGSVATIARVAEQSGIGSPAIIVVGRVAALRNDFSWKILAQPWTEAGAAKYASGEFLT